MGMHPSLSALDHRPWPLPAGPWRWRQSWHDLLFAHWPVPASALRALVPASVAIQEFDGTSWVGVVPFRMTGVMRRPLPDVPGLSAFPELNLRLYVEVGGKPGVWFISLDAANALAVWAARRFFHLPYFRADMTTRDDGRRIHYRSQRRTRANEPRVTFKGSYWPTSEPFRSEPGTLEHFLTERYCLYAQARDGTILRANVHHRPWPLQTAAAELEVNTVGEAQGIELRGAPARLHFSRQLDVVVWSPEPLG
jgi:uncharacterized protein YqjF (DUF2071 family)